MTPPNGLSHISNRPIESSSTLRSSSVDAPDREWRGRRVTPEQPTRFRRDEGINIGLVLYGLLIWRFLRK